MNAFPPARFLDRTTPPTLATLILLAATGSITMNIFLASLPAMAEYFDTPYSVMQLAVTGYLGLTAIAQLVIGSISDRVGRRPVMIWTTVIFLIGSVGAALSTTLGMFMFFRALQAAMVSGFVISRASIRDVVAREDAASRIGYVTMGMALAPMIAPTIGGMLGDAFGWQATFHALTIAGIITLVIVVMDQGETNRTPLDSLTAQFKAYPELMRSRRFWGYAATMTFASGTFFAFLGGAPYVGAVVYDLNATQVGMYLAFTPLGYATGNGLSGRFAQRFGIYHMIVTGALITLFGMAMTLVTAGLGVAHPLGFFAFTFAIGLGNGLVLPSANAGMLDVRPNLAGSAAGLGGALMSFGGAVLSAMAALWLTETSGAYPLIYCILGSSTLCLVCALYTISVERQVRADVPA